MDALASAARAGMRAQATVRRKCPLWKKTKVGDKRGVQEDLPLEKNRPRGLLVKNGTIAFGKDFVLEVKTSQ